MKCRLSKEREMEVRRKREERRRRRTRACCEVGNSFRAIQLGQGGAYCTSTR
jgi:hypothetical protein